MVLESLVVSSYILQELQRYNCISSGECRFTFIVSVTFKVFTQPASCSFPTPCTSWPYKQVDDSFRGFYSTKLYTFLDDVCLLELRYNQEKSKDFWKPKRIHNIIHISDQTFDDPLSSPWFLSCYFFSLFFSANTNWKHLYQLASLYDNDILGIRFWMCRRWPTYIWEEAWETFPFYG